MIHVSLPMFSKVFKTLFLLLAALLTQVVSAADSPGPLAPTRLQCEGRVNPMGIDSKEPRFSWWVNVPRPSAMQGAWQVEVTNENGIKWDSGKSPGANSVEVVYDGPALVSRERCSWRVKTWDATGAESPWSEPVWFEMGLLKPEDWQASWIGHPERFTRRSVPPVYLRRDFDLKQAPVKARLYISARGIFEAEINGRRIGNDAFVPGWTDYSKRNQYLTYDVTENLAQGANTLGVILADGWHNGYLKSPPVRNHYGKDTSLIARLEIETSTGERINMVTDDSWQAATGPILESDIYNGEKYDARAELGAWSSPGYKAEDWLKPRVESSETGRLVAKPCQAVRAQQTLKAKSLTRAPNGEWIFDFGQNLVGNARIQIAGQPARTLTLRFAEMLKPDGSLYLDNLRSAEATDRFTFKDDKPVTWEPSFTFHGFRYVGISGIDTIPTPESVEAIVLHTDAPRTGEFSCSNALLNQLQSNIVWGQKGNYFEVPTDCPQRDERLGWTGDAQVFARTACFNMDVAPFFEKWLADMRDSQMPDGQFPHFAPLVGTLRMSSSAGWADAGVICPWTIHERYGNTRILADNFESMKRWVDYQHRTSKQMIRPEGGFGDWLAVGVQTPKTLIGTAYFAHTSNVLSQAAAVLDRDEEAKQYANLSRQVKDAFNREFVLPDGRLKTESQTGYLLALGFDLLPEDRRAVALEALLADLESRDWHLSTGFLGTGLLMPVLSKAGRNDVAYRILLQETYPGWLYSVRQGATTMWERWNSYTHEKGFGDASMNSFNHYAYGAVGEWMYSVIAGIEAAEPGFRKIRIQPQPGGGLTWAKGQLECPYGVISTDWKLEDKKFSLKVTIPPNTTAIILLPDGTSHEAGSGTHDYQTMVNPS